MIQGIGYSLVPVSDLERFFVLYGPGSSNGKSTLLKLLEALAGAENTASLNVSQLSERFALALLQDKLLCICPEVRGNETLPDDKIKALSSGDLISAEKKNKDLFQFRPFATLWIACNSLPSLRDLSPATLEKRAVVFAMNRSFRGEDSDLGLEHRLLAELPGIFYRCLWEFGQMLLISRQALEHKLINGAMFPVKFNSGVIQDPPSSVALKSQWRQDADPIQRFADDCLTESLGDHVASPDLYAAWSKWRQANGVAVNHDAHALTNRLKRIFPGIKTGDAARIGRKRGVLGLKLTR